MKGVHLCILKRKKVECFRGRRLIEPVGGNGGFTVLEMIIVLLALGILGAAVGYRFSSPVEVSNEANVNQVVADIRYVQMLAAGSGSSKSIVFDGSNQYAVPTYGGSSETRTLPGGTTVSAATITFNSLGEMTSPTQTFLLHIGTQQVTVYAGTGLVMKG